MKRMLLRLAALFLFLFGTGSTLWASDSARTEQVRLSLLPELDAATPGSTLWVGLRFDLIPEWHVYWRNPGDSGEAPRVQWQLPGGWQAGDIHWPTPKRIPVGPLVNYGYSDSVTFLVPVAVPPEQAAGVSVGMRADVNWLVCREECIPQEAVLEITLPVRQAGGHRVATNAFDDVRARWPVAGPGNAGYIRGDDALTLRMEATGWTGAQIGSLWFAANDWGPVAPSQPQTWRMDDDLLVVNLPAGEAPLAEGARLDGLLVVSGPGSNPTRGFTISATPIDTAPDPAGEAPLTLVLALGLALLGGLLLNLMPCVLPVLSIKVLALVQHAGGQSARHGLVFGAGVLLSLLALAGLLIALRAGGAALGWGFQLQEPWVVIALMYLMLALGLNLSGVFSMGGGLTGVGQVMTEQRGFRGTFATGVLAVQGLATITASTPVAKVHRNTI